MTVLYTKKTFFIIGLCLFLTFVKISFIMYLLKTQGPNKLPDFVQLRDDDFTLLAYSPIDRLSSSLSIADIPLTLAELKEIAEKAPYGDIIEL